MNISFGEQNNKLLNYFKEYLIAEELDNINNKKYYLIRLLNNLSEKQIDIVKKEIENISNLNDNFILNKLKFVKNNNIYYIFADLGDKENLKNLRTFINEHKDSNKLIEETIIFKLVS